ncbi:hypothetical protein ROA7450_03671 [Roseovarius albus]|uniref:Uncharacterized protein n=1 Tax=Roseovarius albus TaxID=1247867 RepID=A0A1X7A269_9RHOB|nr:hypothetical protein [Roseovarius albus]SLN68497.1 hypothetical protein ROA7450_03671 [Roseovarius albus]
MKLPAMVPIKSIIVAPGQEIVEGQTVALLDQDFMELEIKNLRRSILVGSSLRHCLLDSTAAEFTTFLPNDLDAESQLQMRAAIKDCQLTHQENIQQQQRLKTIRDRQKTRLGLLEHRATLAFSLTSKIEEKAATAIEFALEQERLTHQLEQLEFELVALDTSQQRELLTRGKTLEQEVVQYRRHLAILQRYSKKHAFNHPSQVKFFECATLACHKVFCTKPPLFRC